jgi:hypothetical protein
MRRCRPDSTVSGFRSNFSDVAQSMDRFIDQIKLETHGEVLGDLEIVRIPLDLYRASRYELYIYRQWLRVYMRSKMIKHNKDLFESLDYPLALLDKLHIY